MKTYSVRFTPAPVDLPDISGYNFDYLNKYEKYILAREDKDKKGNTVPVHYHIYVETSYGEATLRQTTKEALRLPAGGKGKNNGYYSLVSDWKDPGYICKYNDVLVSKGYSEKEILDFVINGKKKYLTRVDKTQNELSGEVAPASEKSATPKRPRINIQQQVIALAIEGWYTHKRKCREEGKHVLTEDVIPIVCSAYRQVSRGLNPYQIRDIAYAVLHEDQDFREYILQKIISKIDI